MDGFEKSVLEKFFEVFPANGNLLIVTHNHPDPDCIASGIGLAQIAKAMGRAHTRVVYGGVIGRAENAHMVKSLKLPLFPLTEKDVKAADKIALVDSQPRTGNNALPAKVVPDLVIDHHPAISHSKKVPFLDIRAGYGATASIITQYIFNFGIEVDTNLATALLYAIKSETQDLGREAFEVDVECYLKLFPLANKKLLAKIVNSRVKKEYFTYLQKAIQNAEMIDTCVVTHLPDLSTPDIVPEVADLLLRLEGATWSFVAGIYKEGIHLSMRTTNTRADAGNLMKQLVLNKGTGGGHSQTAGARVEAKGLEMWQIRELMAELETNFLKKIKKDTVTRISLADHSIEV